MIKCFNLISINYNKQLKVVKLRLKANIHKDASFARVFGEKGENIDLLSAVAENLRPFSNENGKDKRSSVCFKKLNVINFGALEGDSVF